MHKRYLMIFHVYLQDAHIEMILNRSTEEIIAAIKRAKARRGRFEHSRVTMKQALSMQADI